MGIASSRARAVRLTWQDHTIVHLLEPFHGFVFGNLVRRAHAGLLVLALADVEASAAEHDVEVHTVDTDGWIVFDACNEWLEAGLVVHARLPKSMCS